MLDEPPGRRAAGSLRPRGLRAGRRCDWEPRGRAVGASEAGPAAEDEAGTGKRGQASGDTLMRRGGLTPYAGCSRRTFWKRTEVRGRQCSGSIDLRTGRKTRPESSISPRSLPPPFRRGRSPRWWVDGTAHAKGSRPSGPELRTLASLCPVSPMLPPLWGPGGLFHLPPLLWSG